MKVLGGPVGAFLANKLKSASKLNAIALLISFFFILYISKMQPGMPNVLTLATILTMVLAFILMMAKGTMWATMEEAHIPRRLSGTAIAIITYLGFNLTEAVIPMLNGHWLDKYADNLSKAYDNFFLICMVMALAGAVAAILIVVRDKKIKRMQVADGPVVEGISVEKVAEEPVIESE